MIEKYSDHAANERTFLAWIRTGIAVIAFGFVVEKFNIFVRTARMIDDEATHSAGGARAEVVLAITLALAIAVTAIYLAMV